MAARRAVQSTPVTASRALAFICLIAALHGLFFIWYQRPDWNTRWPDQEGYRRLGEVLATTGQFTRFPDAPAFVPEVLRTPAYPIFVALVYRVFGTHQIAVALAQTALFSVVCLVVYAIGRRVASERIAWLAAMATALFPPIPYFAALVMTEVWTTVLFTASMYLAVGLVIGARPRSASSFLLLGFLLGVTTLSRPAFVLFPFALAAVGVIVLPLLRVAERPRATRWALMLAAFAITMLPWFTYNYVTLGRFTLSPAGGIGRGLWEGSWQATWSGRLQNELTHLADDISDRATLDARVRAVAERERQAPEPMLEYVHQWQDIRRIWAMPTDPSERATARVKADQEYQRVAMQNLRRQPIAQLLRRLARGMLVLWAAEIPFRYSDINALPPLLIYLCWGAQAVLVCGAVAGVMVLARRGRVAAASVLATPIVYVTAVHLPLLTEARQSLPVQPIVLLLATIAATNAIGHSLPREPQVHEREHL